MPGRPVLLDITRLITRLASPAPTGIDRVELAYARRFLTGRDAGLAVAITPSGGRLVPRAVAAEILDRLARLWREEPGDPARPGPEAVRIRDWLAGRAASPDAASARPGWTRRRPVWNRLAWAARARFWPEVTAAAPGSIYLHTSHLRLDRPERFGWLAERPDVSSVFFVHDLIPIDFPEYGVAGEADRHRVRMDTIARRAAAVVTNSRDVADRFTRHLADSGLPSVHATAAPLGVEDAFRAPAVPLESERPYLVCCGTIEARKNHLLLLQIWRDLAARSGEVPALVVVGRRGWESEAAVDLLDRCPALRPHVIETSGLPTGDLARLIAGARALLMPSFAEGYGIPVAEALSLGTLVLASDLRAHREVAGEALRSGGAVLLDPLDGPAWRDAILRAAATVPHVGAQARAGYQPPTWAEHFTIVDHVLDGLGSGRPIPRRD